MKNENEINVLDELNKGACMGQDAISFILDKVENPKLKKVLDNGIITSRNQYGNN